MKPLRPLRLFFSVAASLLLFTALPVALHAQATKIFVASFGNDANDGSRGSPKRNFQPAHDAVAAGGQIVVLDTAGYGALTITKSLAVTVPPGVNGFITVSGSGNGITINAGVSDRVALTGLIIENSTGSGPSGSRAISALAVGNLSVVDCTLRDFTEGLFFGPNNSANLYVYHTTARGCGTGMNVQAIGSVALSVTANGCRLERNGSGLQAALLGMMTGGKVDVSLAGSVISGNSNGIIVPGGSATVRVSDCSITGNSFGIVDSGSQVRSRGDNTLENNPNFNTFSGAYSAK